MYVMKMIYIRRYNDAQMASENYITEDFKLPRSVERTINGLKPQFGFGKLGEFVFYRTYSHDGETWNDVVIRVIEGLMSIRKTHYAKNKLDWNEKKMQALASEMAISMFNFEWLPPGRGLWSLGTKLPVLRGGMSLNNCAAVSTKDDIVHAAEWCMDALMCGAGVGFDTTWKGKVEMPDKKDSEVFEIPDSREGWVQSLIKLMCAYIDSPKYGKNKFPTFDYSKIRAAGEPIKTFGGTASGPGPLMVMHKRIEKFLDNLCNGRVEVVTEISPEGYSNVLEDISGDFKKKGCTYVTASKDYSMTRGIADIFNAIGACVVAGNVRRSSQICLGEVEDDDFLNLKNYESNPERCMISGMSNNSCILDQDGDFQDFSFIPKMAARIRDNGEPGLLNRYNLRKYGRYGKPKPDTASLLNPCGEIGLESFELCCLAEVFPPRCADEATCMRAFKYATFYASTVSLLPTHRTETNAVVARNHRIGVSVSGIAMWVSNVCPTGWGGMNYTRLTSVLRSAYDLIVKSNADLNREAGVPPSIRVTTVKPSGTISLLAGVTAGVHFPFSRYCIRRVRVAEGSPTAELLIKGLVPHEKDKFTPGTLVFDFYVDHGPMRDASKVSPWEQLSIVALMQRCYSDNCVSASVYFDKEKDGPDVEGMLAMFIPVLKSVSMFPRSDHKYAQAPYEGIDEASYIKLNSQMSVELDYSSLRKGSKPVGEKFCTADSCAF